MSKLTHFNKEKRAKMVDVSEKPATHRKAVAAGTVKVNAETFKLIVDGVTPSGTSGTNKGDVLAVAQIAGIMAAKRTPDIIPMCHPINITGVDITFKPDKKRSRVDITATVSCVGVTGVEMEALTAVSVAALTIYDMCKAVQKDIKIGNIRLIKKSGGTVK